MARDAKITLSGEPRIGPTNSLARRPHHLMNEQTTTRGAAVLSAFACLPPTIVTTAEIETRLGVEPGWVVRRTGVEQRHRAAPEDLLSDLGAQAAIGALERAGVTADEVDLLLAATMTPDSLTPHVSPMIAHAIGASKAGTSDVGGACSAFLSALTLASGYIEAGRAETVLVVGGDFMSRVLDHDDKVTAGIFGDGIGAVVVQAIDAPSRVGPTVLGSDGGEADAILTPRPAGPVHMDGQRTFRRAIECLTSAAREAVELAGMHMDDIDLFVPHQANGRITRAVGDELGLPPERVVDCINEYGNTTAGTLPIALAHAVDDGRLKPGSVVLLAAFGAGLAWGATVVQWGRATP
jgi:3-oxoacyl-[acyl-carrier-protein] synthase-3